MRQTCACFTALYFALASYVIYSLLTNSIHGTRNGRFFVIAETTMHMITGVGTGNASLLQGGTNGLGRDALENAAQVDTGETRHVALLLTPDYGQQRLRLYIGQKGFKSDGTSCGNCTGDSLLLARNGLAFGSWFYLQGSLPSSGTKSGTFGTVRASGLYGAKLEDVSTNPNNPKQGTNLKFSEPIHLSPLPPSLHKCSIVSCSCKRIYWRLYTRF